MSEKLTSRETKEDHQNEASRVTDQDRFASLFEQSPLSIQIFSPDGRTIKVNRAWEKLWGVTIEQIEDYNILKDQQLIEKGIMPYIERAFAGEAAQIPAILYDPDKTIPDSSKNEEPQKWTTAIIYPLKDAEGAIREVILIHEDITEQKKIEQESERLNQQLEVERKHLQELVSSVPGVVWEAWGEPSESDQRIDFVSDYVTEMLGYTVEEWLSTPNFWLRIVHEDDRDKAAANAAENFAKGATGINTFRWVAKDGSVVWVESQSTVICDEQGNPIGMRGVTMDITERKKREDAERFLFEAGTALSSSLDYEKTLKTIAELAVPHFADWCTIDILNTNGELERLAVTHKDPEKVRWAEELHEKYPPNPDLPHGIYNVLRIGKSEFYPEISDALLKETAQSEEHLSLLREVGFRSAMLVPLKKREHILGVVSFINTVESPAYSAEDLVLAEDLANRASLAIDNAQLFEAEKKVRRAAQKNSNFLKRLLAVSGALSKALVPKEVAEAVIEQGIKSVGAHAGIVVLTDSETKELEVVGTIGFSEELTEKWKRFNLDQKVPLADAIRTQQPVFIESFEKHTDEYPFLGSVSSMTQSKALTAFPLQIKDKTIGGMGLSFQEEQKFTGDDQIFLLALAQQCAQALEKARLYENEQKLRAEAENANRIKDEFLATVSHELRTPLNAIVGWSSLLRKKQIKAGEVERAIETIERNAKSQTQIIEDLLDVSRIITGKLEIDFELIDLTSVAESTVEGLRPTAESKGIKVKTDLAANLYVKGDAERLQQILWNLLSNAIKFTPKGGNIKVKLEQVEEFAAISVKDDGQGIDPKFVPYVFERFRQADATTTRNHGGLGLGLSIVRYLVEMHGGFAEAASEGKDKGSTFIIKIPRVSPEDFTFPKNADFEESNEQNNSLKGLKVLVVDDDKDSLELLKTIVETHGAETKAAESVSIALDFLEEFEPHLIISDIAMPQNDGYTLIQKVRAMSGKRSKIPAIALTAYAREADKERALNAGFQIHLSKPIDSSLLIKAIESFDINDKQPS